MHVTTAPFRCVAREPHGFNSRATEGSLSENVTPSLSLSLFLFLFLPAAHYTYNRALGIEPAVTIVGGGHHRLCAARTGRD